MNPTKRRGNYGLLTVDIASLAKMLGCGESTARRIGEEAEARIQIGRRVLYSVDKVKAFIAKESQ